VTEPRDPYELDVPSSGTSGVYAPRASGFYVTRPSISRYIEETVERVITDAGHEEVRLDVLSEHVGWLDDGGEVAGVFVVTARPRELGEAFTLQLLLPWGETLEVVGEVAWVLDVPKDSLRHRPGMGVRLDLLPAQRGLLERVLLLREPIQVPVDVRRSGVQRVG
jgi:Tfp pilus assembly protein PilZ